MSNDFQYDVFLSHSAKDKELVRPLAVRSGLDEARIRGFLTHFVNLNLELAARICRT